MARASYSAAIDWIADNDDTDWALVADLTDACSTPSVTACLVADLFGKDTEQVRKDVRRVLKTRYTRTPQ